MLILQVLDLDYLKNSYNCINFIRFSKNRYNFSFPIVYKLIKIII